jgi:hypothetical protein
MMTIFARFWFERLWVGMWWVVAVGSATCAELVTREEVADAS